ncbi:CRIB domain-containing protein RIC4-like [Rutidosis leptorrhynchoides]|uniref:CRIB domain-containing protein RIC4-like n=1 Tax=Rutidosis leptorrhynchoides TaxID=125765 RepID=UPI003A990E88
MMMKDRMERLVAFPFANGCVSASSVAVSVQQHHRRSKEDFNLSHIVSKSFDISNVDPKDDGSPTSNESMMKRFTSLSKPNNVSLRLQRLTKTIKSLSQSLAFKDDMDDVLMDLEIGLPTDVKHVAHVGFDGSVTSQNDNDGNIAPSDFLGFCPMSFADLEERLAMCVPIDLPHMEKMLPDIKHTRHQSEASVA